jgi:SP family sugar:H+ symporter-like MFS transporter
VFGFIVSLIITYVNPYVQDEPSNLGSRIGMLYGSVSVISMVFVGYFVPEMKGRSLEELDELFQSKIPAWRAKSYVCTGIGARITAVQNHSSKADHLSSTDTTTVETILGRGGKEFS